MRSQPHPQKADDLERPPELAGLFFKGLLQHGQALAGARRSISDKHSELPWAATKDEWRAQRGGLIQNENQALPRGKGLDFLSSSAACPNAFGVRRARVPLSGILGLS